MFKQLTFGLYLFSVDPQFTLMGDFVLLGSTTAGSNLIKRISGHSLILSSFTQSSMTIIILECRR